MSNWTYFIRKEYSNEPIQRASKVAWIWTSSRKRKKCWVEYEKFCSGIFKLILRQFIIYTDCLEIEITCYFTLKSSFFEWLAFPNSSWKSSHSILIALKIKNLIVALLNRFTKEEIRDTWKHCSFQEKIDY